MKSLSIFDIRIRERFSTGHTNSHIFIQYYFLLEVCNIELHGIQYLLDRYICISYIIAMIRSFGDSETEKIFHQVRSKRLPPEIHERALIKLLMIDASTTEEDFRVPPSNRFEHLQGRLKGYCSIRINDQWRIIFRFRNGEAFDVSIVDYH